MKDIEAFLLIDPAEARRIGSIRTTQRGRIRSAPNARWLDFTASERIDSTASAFRWEARFGAAFQVIDAYGHGRGLFALKLGGLIPVKKYTGPAADQGELQRYLASLFLCPPMLCNHPALDWTPVGDRTWRVRDLTGPQAAVDHEFDAAGRPLLCRALRPRILGKNVVPTPWSAAAGDFREFGGLRIARHVEASWCPPENPFVYFEAEVISFTAVTAPENSTARSPSRFSRSA